MIKEFQGRIKVETKVKPLRVNLRKTPEIKVGEQYYVSFGTNNAYPCTVVEILNDFPKTEIKISIPMKPKSQRGFIDINGNRSYDWKSIHTIYPHEIGLTPEDAIRNEVHF